MKLTVLVSTIFLFLLFGVEARIVLAADHTEAKQLFQTHCSQCHGAKRYGSFSPPLLPQFLKRKNDEKLAKIIAKGLPASQMAPFEKILKPEQIKKLVALIRTPVGKIEWGPLQIKASKTLFQDVKPTMPKGFDRSQIILIVERGTQSISVFDGKTMEALDRFEVGKIHGGPKFDDQYERVFVVTRDGTLTTYDLKQGMPLAKIKAAINTRNIAISPDGKTLAVANLLPQNLTLFDANLNIKRIIPLPGKPSGVYHLRHEKKFILALREKPILYILDYSGGHIEQVRLKEPFEDFMFVPGQQTLLTSSRKGQTIRLYSIKERRSLGSLEMQGFPHLFSAAFFKRNGRLHAALNHMNRALLSVIDLENFKLVASIRLKGSGYFVRTHPGTPYIWVDTNTEVVQLVNKKNLYLAGRSLKPEKGKKAMHIEFDKSGSKALISIWHKQGGVAIYDSKSLEMLMKLPFNMPIGKYNAFNKTHNPL